MKLYELYKGDKIISADNRIWEIRNHDGLFTNLVSGTAQSIIRITSEVKKIKGGYIILKSKE